MERWGSEVTLEMLPLILWEGYCDGEYTDTKGVVTSGVGQTGRYASMSYPEAFISKKGELQSLTPRLTSLPDGMQDALIVSHYRGTWRQSKKTRGLFDDERYQLAAEEYLDNNEYRDEDTPDQIKERFVYVADAIRSMGKQT